MIPMTDDEVDRHVNPEKYLSDEEKAQLNRERMLTLTPIEFDIKLIDAGLYDQVQKAIPIRCYVKDCIYKSNIL